jgi:TfoX/Sxy family transcriptional regulator of competence genes
MPSMKWVRPSPSTLEYFERLSPGPPLETRKMFGLPSRFLNGYMLVGVFGDALVLHLSPSDRLACIKAGATPFKPMGRDMKAYATVAPGTFEDHDLKWWIVRGMRHIATLPPRIGVSPAPRRSRAPASSARMGTAVTTKAKAKTKAKVKAKAKVKTKTKTTKKTASARRVVRRPATKAARVAARPVKNAAKRGKAPKKARPAPRKRSARR